VRVSWPGHEAASIHDVMPVPEQDYF